MPCRTKKSSTCLHLMMHIFMVHGVDPLVEEAVNNRLIIHNFEVEVRINFTLGKAQARQKTVYPSIPSSRNLLQPVQSLLQLADMSLPVFNFKSLRLFYIHFFFDNCNVPTLGHHHSAEVSDDQSSQMDVIVSTGVIQRHCGVQLALLIIFHHYEAFRTGWLWFRCIPTISMILTILSYKLIEFIEEVILGTLLGGTSQCNSSLESGEATLHDGLLKSDF
jgi:hypothetical protein